MRHIMQLIAGLPVVLAIFLMLSGCGERSGSYTFEIVLDETMDGYVHPTRRGDLDLTTAPPEGLRGTDRFSGREVRYADLRLGNLTKEPEYLALGEGPEGIEVVLDQNLALDLSNDSVHPLHAYAEGSPYFLSENLSVSYPVDTGGNRHLV